MTPTTLARRLALLLASASLVVACGATPGSPTPSTSATGTPTPVPSVPGSATPSTVPSAAPSEDAAATYARIDAQVQEIRGLDERKPVVPQIVSPDELSAVIRSSFDTDYPPEKVAIDERLYQRLGLLDADQRLAEVYVDLLESQVAGLYDPATEQLYVLSKAGGVGPVEQVFYSHEYDHALQDQHFDLETFMDGLDGQSDRAMARQALVEGDAYVLMTYWLQQHLGPSELAEVIAASSDPEALAALEKIPPIVQAQLLFAATQGTQWAIGQQIGGGWEAIDEAFENPPVSTEQILHADKWLSREAPIAVRAPSDLVDRLGDGWTVALEDTLGEYQAGIWLGAGNEAVAAGWGGDRLTMVEGPDGAWGIGWRTAWDTAADADEFTDAAQARLRELTVPSRIVAPGGTEVTVLIASDDAALLALDKVYGSTGV